MKAVCNMSATCMAPVVSRMIGTHCIGTCCKNSFCTVLLYESSYVASVLQQSRRNIARMRKRLHLFGHKLFILHTTFYPLSLTEDDCAGIDG